MNKTLYLLILICIFGCQDPLQIEPVPPTAVPINVSIEISDGYLSSCDDSDGNTDRVTVNWIVNALDNVTGRPRAFRAGNYEVDNDDEDNANLTGVVIAPSLGTWSLQLDIKVPCSVCCDQEVSTEAPERFACNSFRNQQTTNNLLDGRGEPQFTAFVAMVNQSNPPSPVIVNDVMLFTCLDCNLCI